MTFHWSLGIFNSMSRTCKDCGETFEPKQKVWVCSKCKQIRAKTKGYLKKKCVDCGGLSTSTRCRPCFFEKQKGETNSRWKGWSITGNGYKLIKMHGHPNSQANGWIMEHVYVMSEHLGRPLIKGENVHHRNGDRLDNRIENLELWSVMQPSGQRVSDRIKDAKRTLLMYGTDESLY